MNNLLKNWNVARLIRLIIGVGIAIYSIVSQDYLFMFLAGFFLLQAVFNISCCGASGCSSSDSTKDTTKYNIRQYKPKD